jgi:uncharacterized protein YggE
MNAAEYVVVILALLAFVAVLLNSGIAKQQPGQAATTVTVTASGSASSIADAAQIYLFMNGTGNTTQAAVANLSRTMGLVNSTLLKYVNGNLSDISTGYFNVNACNNYPYRISATTTYPPTPPNRTCGYMASESLLVIIPDANNVTSALESLTSMPNVYVTSVDAKLTNQQIGTLRGQALAYAMSNATGQAKVVSPTGNVSALNITVNGFYLYPLQYSFGTAGTTAPGVAAAELQNSLFYKGTSSVTESVTVVFAVQH